MRITSVVVVVLVLMLAGCAIGNAIDSGAKKRYENHAHYIELIPPPVDPVSMWGSRVPTTQAEFMECVSEGDEPRPKKGTNLSLNGKECVVLGNFSYEACRFSSDFAGTWYFKFRWEEPIRSDKMEWIDGCRIDGAVKSLQLQALLKKEADALVNIRSYCGVGGIYDAYPGGSSSAWSTVWVAGTVIKWVEPTDE